MRGDSGARERAEPGGARGGAALAGLRVGLVAGLLAGVVEAPERAIALRGFLRGAPETAWLAGLILFFSLLAGALLGLAGGASVALARVVRRVAPLGARAWDALLGAATGAGVAVAGVFALTLTVRFDAVIARWPVLLAAGALAGLLAGIAWDRVVALAASCRRGAAGAVIACVVVGSLLVLYFMNTYFAPQSSYGVHLILVAALAASAFLSAWLLPRALRARAAAAGVALLALLVIPADYAMRNRPRLEYFVKIRTSTTARCVDLLSCLTDWDGDRMAPAFLLGGDDTAPLDPTRPAPILPRARAERAAGDDRPAPAAAAADSGGLGGKPHLLLLTLDACRADVVAPTPVSACFLGTLRPPTPVLDSLAARSVRFEAAHTPSAGTEDTFNSLFTGELPPGYMRGIDPARFLAVRLARRGYAVRAWFDDPHASRSLWGFPLAAYARRDAPRMMRDAAEFLGALPPGRPGFAWVHVMDLHSEVLNPLSLDAYSRSRKMAAYAHAMGRVDSLVGMLTDALRRQGLETRTLIAVSADHGEEFGEHGHFHHNLALYEPAIRVPLWLSGPGIEARTIHATASLEDLYPTLLEVAGVAPGPTPARSLWPLISGASVAAAPTTHYAFLPQRGFSRRYATWSRPERGTAALIDPVTGHKVIVRYRRQVWEAYDLSRDPMERNDLAGDGLGWPDSMRAELEAQVRRNAEPAPR